MEPLRLGELDGSEPMAIPTPIKVCTLTQDAVRTDTHTRAKFNAFAGLGIRLRRVATYAAVVDGNGGKLLCMR